MSHCACAGFIKHSHCLEASLHLLGLGDSLEEGTLDPIVTSGAYLSLTYLRHLKLRQLMVTCLYDVAIQMFQMSLRSCCLCFLS